MPVIQALGRLRQEDHELVQGYIEAPSIKQTEKMQSAMEINRSQKKPIRRRNTEAFGEGVLPGKGSETEERRKGQDGLRKIALL